MNNNKSNITGILLAGGLSKRMGREKGTLKIGDNLLFQYPLKVLERICGEILISTCNDSTLPVDYPKVCDEVKGIGPMGGIYTCLKHSSNDLNIIISYDMPLVSDALINHLIGESESFDMVLPALTADRPEPLCGLYRKNCVGIFEKCIEQKVYAVHLAMALSKSNVVLIDEKMSFWNPRIFLNVNSEEDLEDLPKEYRN